MNDDLQPEFRSLREFYIIIFLNKPKINQNKASMAKGSFRFTGPFLALKPGPMYWLNPPLIGPAYKATQITMLKLDITRVMYLVCGLLS